MHGNVMDAVPDLRRWIGNVLRMKAAVDRLPCFAAILGTKCPGRRDRNENSTRISRIDKNAMQAHAACAGLPLRPGTVTAQPGKLVPVSPAVAGTKQGGIFDAGIDRVRVRERRFEMPNPLELPRMRRAVVPLVRRQGFAGLSRRIVNKFITLSFGHSLGCSGRFSFRGSGLVPRFPAIIRALNDLAEPAARLRSVQPVRISRGSF